jgi:glycerol-3-phosphate dehydrogenase
VVFDPHPALIHPLANTRIHQPIQNSRKNISPIIHTPKQLENVSQSMQGMQSCRGVLPFASPRQEDRPISQRPQNVLQIVKDIPQLLETEDRNLGVSSVGNAQAL